MSEWLSPDGLEQLRRYAGLIDDWEGFLAASVRPLPKVVWPNTLKISAGACLQRVRNRCAQAQSLDWAPDAWRIPPAASAGKWPEFHLGLLHVQEEITLFPALALGAEPGEAVLDMCAAPGNKTARIVADMRDSGLLVANEANRQRMAALQNVMYRLGVTCAMVTRGDGTGLSGRARYDRVLVDVPCTGEGTSRKPGGWRKPRGPEEWLRLCGLQRGLLRRGVELARPGGVIVYCTCTYAPEENEWVLDGIDPARAEIEPVRLPGGLRAAPGVKRWEGREFRADVGNGLRFWPHLNDTGGFFVARLRRL
jgi:16S rRNA C967 or C1407 C5-methylase (RsmB/RsmF family)